MPILAPRLAEWLKEHNGRLARWRKSGGVATVENARKGIGVMARFMHPAPAAVPFIADAVCDDGNGAPVRIYHPDPGRRLPVLVYFHGGGHVVGTLDDFDPVYRSLAVTTRHIVIASEYRLAPEHPYPADLLDASAAAGQAYALLEALRMNFARRLRLGGDSAGGTLAATLAHQNDLKEPIEKLVLFYPSLDYSRQLGAGDPLATGYFLERDQLSWYLDLYLRADTDRRDISPLYMKIPEEFPPTLIISAGFCPIRTDSERYAERLRANGVAVEYHCFDDVIHAFLNLEKVVPDACARAYALAAEFLGGN